MSDPDPFDFSNEPIESKVATPMILLVDGVAPQLLTATATEKLSQFLNQLTRDVVARAHRIAIGSTFTKYPFPPVEASHVERAASDAILSLASAISEGK